MLRRGLRRFCFLAIAGLLMGLPGYTQSGDLQEDRVSEGIDTDKGRVMTATEELVEMLKQRSLLKVEKEQRKQMRMTKGTIGFHIGQDNNVNTSSARQGDFYNEQYFAFSWVPTFDRYLAAEVGTWYYSDMYFNYRDLTIADNAFNASLKWYPWGIPDFELQPGMEYAFAYYPYCDTSSYVEDKVFLKFKHRFWQRWAQDGAYEFSLKEYDAKQPRDEAYNYLSGMVVEKEKHSVEYNLAIPFFTNNLKIKQKLYKETSNDLYHDYYDVYSYKATGEIGRSLNKKLYAKLSTAFERKNYNARTVTSRNVAEYDDVYTHKLSLYYTLKKNWTLSYALTLKKSASNYDLYDYDTISHLAGVYISF